MSLTLKVNFLKGWPCPSIVDKVGNIAAADAAFLTEGSIASLNSSGEWIRPVTNNGATAQNSLYYILWNGAGSNGDQNPGFNAAQDFNQVGWGGVQGIALINQLEIETSQFTGVPVFGQPLTFDEATSKVRLAVGHATPALAEVVIGICTNGVHKMAAGSGNVDMISFIPTQSNHLFLL